MASLTDVQRFSMQILKTTETRVCLLESVIVFYSLAAGATPSGLPSYLLSVSMVARLALPTIAVAILFFVRNLQAKSAERAGWAPVADIVLALSAVLLSQIVLLFLRPGLVMPHYHFTSSALLGWGFVLALRAWFPHGLKPVRLEDAARPLTIEKLRWTAIEFEIKAKEWSNWGTLLAVAAIGLLTLSLPFAQAPQVQLASALLIAGAIYIAWIIRKRGNPAAAPLGGGRREFSRYCQRELQHQSLLLHRLWHWYFGSLIPAVLLLLQGRTLYAYFVIGYVLLIGELLYQAIEKLQLQLTQIQSSESA